METQKINSRSFLKGTFTYMVGAVLVKGGNIILLPVYTTALATSGYGLLAMLTVVGGIVNVTLNFGLGSAIVVQYKEYQSKGKEKTIENTIITFLLIIILLALLALGITCPLYADILIKAEGGSVNLIRLYLLVTASNILVGVFYTLLRIRFQEVKLVIVNLVSFFSSTSLIIFFVLKLKWGLEGVILGMLIPSISILIYFLTTWGYKPEFDWRLFKPLFRFGIWLVPGNLGTLIYTFSDRFFVQEYFSLAEVGIYTIAIRLSGVMTVFLLNPFRQAFRPYIFQQGQEIGHGINKGIKFLLIISGLGFLGISLASEPIIRLMATREFLPAASIIPILALVEIVNALIQVVNVGIHKAGKSYIGSMIIWIGAVINIGLNFLLIPGYKIMGAALATLATYLVMTALYFYFSSRETRYPIDYKFALAAIAVTGVCYFAGSSLMDMFQTLFPKLIVYGFIMAGFLSAMYVFLSREEKLKLKDFIAQKKLVKRIMN
jgi:O-antigen/teichoic acid export membrane protein